MGCGRSWGNGFETVKANLWTWKNIQPPKGFFICISPQKTQTMVGNPMRYLVKNLKSFRISINISHTNILKFYLACPFKSWIKLGAQWRTLQMAVMKYQGTSSWVASAGDRNVNGVSGLGSARRVAMASWVQATYFAKDWREECVINRFQLILQSSFAYMHSIRGIIKP